MRWVWLGHIDNANLILRNWGCNTALRPAAVGPYCTPNFSKFGQHLPMRPRQTHGIPPVPLRSYFLRSVNFPPKKVPYSYSKSTYVKDKYQVEMLAWLVIKESKSTVLKDLFFEFSIFSRKCLLKNLSLFLIEWGI